MARKQYPDHAGRMPDHEAEETARIQAAAKNLDDWRDKYGGQFSGGVTVSYGNTGDTYHVPIGDPKIAQEIVSRPIKPSVEVKALSAEPAPIPVQLPPQQSVLSWLIDRIKGAFK